MLEYREQAQLDAIDGVTAGESIYPADASGNFYLYGFLLPWGAAILKLLTGTSTILAGRLFTLAMNLAAMALAAFAVMRHSRLTGVWRWACGLTAALWVTLGNWLGVTAAAPMGMATMLAAILLCTDSDNSRRNIASALLTVACFYVKPYFLGVALPLAVYLLITNRKQFVVYAVTGAVAGIGSVILTRYICDGYFIYNFLHHFNVRGSNLNHLALQLATMLFYWGVLPLAFIAIVATHFKSAIKNKWAICTLCWLVIFLRIGQHPGAFMHYLLQTAVPCAAIYVMQWVDGSGSDISWRKILLAAMLCLGIWPHYEGRRLCSEASERLVAEQQRFLTDTNGKAVINLSPVSQWMNPAMENPDNGNTCYRSTLICDDNSWIATLLMPKDVNRLNESARGDHRRVTQMLESGKYDYILTDRLAEYQSCIDGEKWELVDSFFVCPQKRAAAPKSYLLKAK